MRLIVMKHFNWSRALVLSRYCFLILKVFSSLWLSVRCRTAEPSGCSALNWGRSLWWVVHSCMMRWLQVEAAVMFVMKLKLFLWWHLLFRVRLSELHRRDQPSSRFLPVLKWRTSWWFWLFSVWSDFTRLLLLFVDFRNSLKKLQHLVRDSETQGGKRAAVWCLHSTFLSSGQSWSTAVFIYFCFFSSSSLQNIKLHVLKMDACWLLFSMFHCKSSCSKILCVVVRNNLQETFEQTKGCQVVINLKSLQMIN